MLYAHRDVRHRGLFIWSFCYPWQPDRIHPWGGSSLTRVSNDLNSWHNWVTQAAFPQKYSQAVLYSNWLCSFIKHSSAQMPLKYVKTAISLLLLNLAISVHTLKWKGFILNDFKAYLFGHITSHLEERSQGKQSFTKPIKEKAIIRGTNTSTSRLNSNPN